MKRLLSVVLYVFMIVSLPSYALPAIHFWKTTSGVPVYFIQRHNAPMLDIQILFPAGSARGFKQPGLAYLTNQMLGMQARRLSTQHVLEQLDTVGSILKRDVKADYATLGIRTLSKPTYLNRSIKLLSALIGHAVFSQKNLEIVRANMTSLILQRQQNPSAVAIEALSRSVYGSHPYAMPKLGTLLSIKKIKLSDVQQFYKHTYNQSQAKILLIGDISQAHAKKVAERLSNKLQHNPVSLKPIAAISQSHHTYFSKHINFSSEQTAVVLGQLGIPMQATNRFALTLATVILGQVPLDSILFKQIREQAGYAYNPAAMLLSRSRRGLFFVSFNTRYPVSQKAVHLLKKVMTNYIQKGPTQHELDVAKQFILGSFKIDFVSNDDLGQLLSEVAFYNLPLDQWQRAMSAYQSMTLKDVNVAIHQYLSLQKMILITVGKAPAHEAEK